MKETAGYFSTTAPVIAEGLVIAAYSSGEVFALRAETGNVVWSDTLGNAVKTRASAVFSGIDADPIVQDGVVVVVSASGEMQASALLNGRPLWQIKLGAHSTPWSAGNALFVLSDTHDIAAIFKRDGSIRWATSLAVADKNDSSKDRTPPLYGPILAGNVVMVLDHNGQLMTFKPDTGERLRRFELARPIVTSPIIAGGAMMVVTKDARLHKYY
jgi:outer membrane protein assembly factor BamB